VINIELITDLEAEKRVLSAMLHDEPACIEALDILNEDDFSQPFSRSTFLLIDSLYHRGIKPTLVEVIKEGYTLGFISNPRDMEELQYIAEHYINEENIKYWVGKVKEASKGRMMQRLLKKYTNDLNKETADITSLIREASGELFSLAVDTETEKITTAKELAEYGEKLLKERIENYRKVQEECKILGQVPLEGVPTGFRTLDRLSLGYKPGDLIVLAAQTGHGKTAFAINTASAVCIDGKRPLYYINTEMTQRQLSQRWGATIAGIPLQQIRNGSVRDDQVSQILAAYQLLSQSGFYTSYLPNLTPAKADILTRKAKMQFNIEIMILDYVGRMETKDPRLQEWQVLYDIIKSQKLLAQNLEIACMVLAQLNDDGTLQGAKRIKNECDMLLKLIPVADQEQADKIQEKLGTAFEPFNYRLFVDKARDFESGITIPLVFDKEKQQIREAQEVGKYVSQTSHRAD
jgi:replicative DNA helicase